MKAILPDVKTLEKMYERDKKSFVRWVKKTELFVGPMESMAFLDQIMLKELEDKKTSESDKAKEV